AHRIYRRALRLHHGLAAGGALFRRPDHHFPFRQELQGSAELCVSLDDPGDRAGGGRHASGRRAHRQAGVDSDSERQPAVQGIGYWNLSLEFHRPDLPVHLRLRLRRPVPGGENVPARRRALPLVMLCSERSQEVILSSPTLPASTGSMGFCPCGDSSPAANRTCLPPPVPTHSRRAFRSATGTIESIFSFLILRCASFSAFS